MNWQEEMKIQRWAWYVLVAMAAIGVAGYLIHWWQLLSPYGNRAIQHELATNQVDLARNGQELRSIVDNHRMDAEQEASMTRERLKRIEKILRRVRHARPA